MKTIANVQFSESGILIERKYQEDPDLFRKPSEELYTGKFLELAHRLAKKRMYHCYKKLHANLSKATHITSVYIAWKDGNFSVPVWESLERILQITDVRELDMLQCQQIIRAIIQDMQSWVSDYDMTTYEYIKDSNIYITEDFKNFITEHMMVVANKMYS